MTVPSVNPALVRVVLAALWVRPTTLGTLTGAGPELTTRSTAVPGLTLVLAVGDWLMTAGRRRCPAGRLVTVPSVNPALVRVVAAALWVRPTTLGTLTGAGPLS